MTFFDSLPIAVPSLRVIDVGASLVPGVKPVQERLFPRFAGEVIGFEPIARECDRLVRGARPWEKYHPYLLGDGRPKTLHVTRDTYSSSVYEPDQAMIELFQAYGPMFEVIERIELPSKRLDEVEGLEAGADLIKLDTQGSEFDILAHAPRLLRSAVVVITEAFMVPMYKQQPLFADVDALLRAQGFHFHRFLFAGGQKLLPFATGKYGDKASFSQLLWVDCVYVRALGTIPSLAAESLIKLALLLHECFGSFDLAHYCLAQYDRRQRTDLAPGFRAALGLVPPST